MSSIKRVFLTFFACLILLFSFVLPSSAAESDYVFQFNIPEPLANEYSGYIVQPFVRKDNLSLTLCNIYFWTITPVNPSDSGNIPFSSYSYNSSSGTATLQFGTGSNTGSWYVSLWTTTPGNSNIRFVASELLDYSTALTFTIKASTNSNSNYWWLTPKFKGLSIADSLPTGRSETYDVLFGSDSLIYSEMLKVEQHFISMLQKQDYTNEQLDSLVESFQLLLDSVYSMDFSLDTFVFYYWEQFQNYDFPDSMYAINQRLDKIYNLLNKKGDVEQTTVDSSKVDEYADIEQSLVHNDEANSAIGDMDVSIDGQSYSVIWDIITNILNSHPEVFGLVITILTLGFLALILNR